MCSLSRGWVWWGCCVEILSNGQVELWNGHSASLKDADSWVVWTHLHKREAFRGSKSYQHSRKPSNIHHCQAPSQVLKMTCETNNGQESNIWMSKAFITFSPRRWKSRLQPNLKSRFTLFHLFLGKVFCFLFRQKGDPQTWRQTSWNLWQE